MKNMNDSTLHIGTLATNNVVNDINKYAEQKEHIKDLAKEISSQKDSYETVTEPLEYVCECYKNYSIVTGMPKSTFGDTFGYEMQKNISNYMKDFYTGKVSQEELDSYFEECCTSMRIYRTQQHQTSGTNEEDNAQIVSEMYEIFAKENARAARSANYQEGKAINASSYPNTRDDDWTYYNADYYYKCSETKEALRQSALEMTEKWNLDAIDCDEIEKNSKLTLDGGFDFNSGWNWSFRNQVGRSSITTEDEVPPKDFKMFFKQSVTPDAKDVDEAFKGNLEITIGESKYDVDIPFKILRTGPEGGMFNAWDLMNDHFSETEDSSQIKKFLSNISVFTRWYSYETKINDRFGDYAL
jgi:hypothetical protein